MSWEKMKLVNIASIKTGRLDSNEAVEDGLYPFFTCSQQTFRINTPAFDTQAVLLGGNNAAGIFPLKYYEGQFNAYQRTYVIESLDPDILNTRFLYYALRPALSHFQSVSIGAATQYLTKKILDNFQVNIPSISEQQKIALILSAYDDLIENNRRRIELLEAAARMLYKEWFVYLRFPGHEHVKVVDGIPEGWDFGIVSDFYDTASGGTPSRKRPEYFTGDLPWVKTQELPNGFILDTEEHITEDAVKNSAAKLFLRGTVLVALYGATIGEVGILSNNSTCNQACCAIIPKDSRSHTIHAYLFFRENKKNLVALSGGAAQNNISQQIIRGFPMMMPSSKISSLFIDDLQPIFDQWLNLECQNRRLKQARDLLLPKLMNGEIAV